MESEKEAKNRRVMGELDFTLSRKRPLIVFQLGPN